MAVETPICPICGNYQTLIWIWNKLAQRHLPYSEPHGH